MSTQVMERSSENVLGLQASGKLSDEDYKDTWLPNIERVLEEQGSIRLVIYMDDDFDGFEAGAMWDDAKFGFKHFGDIARGRFQKIAVVGGSSWDRRVMEMCGHLAPGEVKGFAVDQLEAGWEWVEG